MAHKQRFSPMFTVSDFRVSLQFLKQLQSDAECMSYENKNVGARNSLCKSIFNLFVLKAVRRLFYVTRARARGKLAKKQLRQVRTHTGHKFKPFEFTSTVTVNNKIFYTRCDFCVLLILISLFIPI